MEGLRESIDKFSVLVAQVVKKHYPRIADSSESWVELPSEAHELLRDAYRKHTPYQGFVDMKRGCFNLIMSDLIETFCNVISDKKPILGGEIHKVPLLLLRSGKSSRAAPPVMRIEYLIRELAEANEWTVANVFVGSLTMNTHLLTVIVRELDSSTEFSELKEKLNALKSI